MSANVEVVSKAKVNLKVTTVAGAGGGGTSDHGALTGLGDDDHPQYQRSEATYTSTSPFTITDESVVITAGSAVTLPDAATMASRLVGVGAAASTVAISPAGTDTMFDDPGNNYSLPAGNGITFVSVQIGGAWGWAIYTRNGPAFDMPKWFGQSLADGSVLKIASGVPAWGAAPAPTAHASSHGSAGSDPITVAQSQVTNLTTDLAGKVPTTRTVNGQALSADITVTAAPSGSAGGDLTGTYPNPTIGTGAVTSAKIADGTIVNGDISASAAIDASKLSGLAAIATSGSASNLTTGTVPSARLATKAVGGQDEGTTVNEPATATSLLDSAITLPACAAGDVLLVNAGFTFLQNSGAGRAIVFGLKLGTTTILSSSLTITQSATTRSGQLAAAFRVEGTSDVNGSMSVLLNNISTPWVAHGVATENIGSGSLTLDFVVTATNNTTQQYQLQYFTVSRVAA